MNINIEEKTENRFTFKIENQNDTLCNVIVKHLSKNKNINFVAYKRKHFTENYCFLTIELKKGNLKETIISSVNEIINNIDKNIL